MHTFRSFEVYIVVAVIYFGAVGVDRFGFWAIGRLLFGAGAGWGRRCEPARRQRSSCSCSWRRAGPSCWRSSPSPAAAIVGLVARRAARLAARRAALAGQRLHPVLQGHAAADPAVHGLLRPRLLGFQPDPLVAAGLSLTLYAAAFFGEILRGCIEAVPRTQWEASTASASRFQHDASSSCRRRCGSLPPTVGFMVQIVKNTSVASLIGFVELARAGQVNNSTFQPS